MGGAALTFSVALCTHNGARFIAEQVRSILNQSVPPTQLVLSDDSSTDATVTSAREVVSRFQAEHPEYPLQFTVLVNQEPLGVTANFQQAIVQCTGELIALSDQDDVWAPNRLERFAEQFAARPELSVLHSDARLVDESGHPIGQALSSAIGFSRAEERAIHEGNALKVLLRRNVVTGATTVFRRDLVDASTPFPESWLHDEWLAMVAAVIGLVDFLPEQLTDYRQHELNQIGASTPTAAQLFGRLREPRFERNARLLERAQALADRASHLDALAGDKHGHHFAARAAGKLAHERSRSALAGPRILRVLPVLREVLTGRYHRYGRARYDIVRDLVQPQ